MIIRIDTREQTPLDFTPYCEVVRNTVPFYDYALDGDQTRFAVERKSLEDYVGSVVMQDRLLREITKREKARAAGMVASYYVVEANFRDIRTFNFKWFVSGRVHAGLVYRRWSELAIYHGIHTVFAGDHTDAAFAVYTLLKRRNEQLLKGQAQEDDNAAPQVRAEHTEASGNLSPVGAPA